MSKWLDQINSPQDLKDFPLDKLDELAGEIREKIVTAVSRSSPGF
jgi:deoxyxylulose-5-phosphate synthase